MGPLVVSATSILRDTHILFLYPVSSATKQLVIRGLPAIRCKPNRREATMSQFHFNLVSSFIEFVTNASWMIAFLPILEDTFLLLEEAASREIKDLAHLVSPASVYCGGREGKTILLLAVEGEGHKAC